MKNEKLRNFFFQTKIFPIMIFIIVSSASFSSASEKFNFSIKPEFGILNGHIYEYVFDESSSNTNNIVSKLDWEVIAIPYAELSTNFNFFKYINLCVNGKVGIHKKSGYMQDYDWLEYTTELTNYSKSTNKLNSFYTINASLGANIYATQNLIFTIFAAYDYMYIGFDSYDGYNSYKTNNWKNISMSGKVISYFQEYNSCFFGIKSQFLINRFEFSSDLSFCPTLSVNNALDYHYINGKQAGTGTLYWDNITSIFQLKQKLSILYNINKHSKIGISSAFKYIPISKGDDYCTKITSEGKILDSTNFSYGGIAGSSAILWTFSIFYDFNF